MKKKDIQLGRIRKPGFKETKLFDNNFCGCFLAGSWDCLYLIYINKKQNLILHALIFFYYCVGPALVADVYFFLLISYIVVDINC